MNARPIIRNREWENDHLLQEDLRKYVAQNLKRSEILDFVKRDFGMYSWSLRTLSRRMKYFEIKYIDYDTSVEAVEQAVTEEMDGPGKLLGYRALHKKIRELHELNVPRALVHDMMYQVNPDGLEQRGGVGVSNKPRRDGTFTAKVTLLINCFCLSPSYFPLLVYN